MVTGTTAVALNLAILLPIVCVLSYGYSLDKGLHRGRKLVNAIFIVLCCLLWARRAPLLYQVIFFPSEASRLLAPPAFPIHETPPCAEQRCCRTNGHLGAQGRPGQGLLRGHWRGQG